MINPSNHYSHHELTLDDENIPLIDILQRGSINLYFVPANHHSNDNLSKMVDVKKFQLQLILVTCQHDQGQPKTSSIDLNIQLIGPLLDKSKYMIVFQKPVLNLEDMIRHGVMKMYFYLKDSHGNEYKSKKYDFMVPGEQSIPCSGMIDSQVSNVNNTMDSSVPIERRLVLKKLKESPLGSSLSDIHFNQFLSNLFENISSSTLELFNVSTFPYFGNYDIQKHTFTLTDDGRGRDSAWHSCCRFSQILISLNLGKALLFVRMINTKKPNGQQQSSNDNNSSPQKSLTFDEVQKFNSSHIEFACQSLIQIPTMKGNYKFFATSNSGTKGETCCFVHDSFNLQQLRNLLGDFSKAEKSGPCKTFSRVALNFGKCVKSDRPFCEEEQVAYLPPEYEIEFPGTDGIGFIHEHLAHELLLNINDFVTREKLLFNNQKELRGVGAIQVRYSGCKGVLQLIPASYWPILQKKYKLKDSIRVVFRDSMVKFKGNTCIYPYMDILNYSCIQGGNMNRNDMSCLLKRTDRPQEMQQVFMESLREYLSEFVVKKDDRAFICNQLFPIQVDSPIDSMDTVIHSMVLAGQRLDNPFLQKRIHKKIKNKFQSMLEDTLNLRIPFQCVDLMGEIDESETLKEDEIYVPCEKLIQDLGLVEYQKLEHVIVYRQPLTYEGDFTKFKLIKYPQNDFLKSRINTVVFPKVKRQKSPHQFMAGGDLDGDLYKVIYNPKIVNLFHDILISKIDYDEGKKTAVAHSTPTIHDCIQANIKAFSNKNSHTGLLYYHATVLRSNSHPSNLELRRRVCVAHAESIDATKSDAPPSDYRKLYQEIEKLKLKKPEWLEMKGKMQLKNLSQIMTQWQQTNSFECEMIKIVLEQYNLLKMRKRPYNMILDPDLSNTGKYKELEMDWKLEFEKGLSEWNLTWSSQKSFDQVPSEISQAVEESSSQKRLHRRAITDHLVHVICENISSLNEHSAHSLRWISKFVGKDNNEDILLHKASYWLSLAYEDSRQPKRPFVYTCCYVYLNYLKTGRSCGNVRPVHPSIPIRVKQ